MRTSSSCSLVHGSWAHVVCSDAKWRRHQSQRHSTHLHNLRLGSFELFVSFQQLVPGHVVCRILPAGLSRIHHRIGGKLHIRNRLPSFAIFVNLLICTKNQKNQKKSTIRMREKEDVMVAVTVAARDMKSISDWKTRPYEMSSCGGC